MTVLTGDVADQAHLHGIIQRIQELGNGVWVINIIVFGHRHVLPEQLGDRHVSFGLSPLSDLL